MVRMICRAGKEGISIGSLAKKLKKSAAQVSKTWSNIRRAGDAKGMAYENKTFTYCEVVDDSPEVSPEKSDTTRSYFRIPGDYKELYTQVLELTNAADKRQAVEFVCSSIKSKMMAEAIVNAAQITNPTRFKAGIMEG